MRSLRAILSALRGDSARKILALVLLSLGASLLVVGDLSMPERALRAGEVADRDVRAPISFEYHDSSRTEEEADRAEEEVLPVYDLDTNLLGRVRSRMTSAFDMASQRHNEALLAARVAGQADLSEEQLGEIARDFVKVLEVNLDPNDLQRVVDARWDRRIEAVARDLVGVALNGYVIGDRDQLPQPTRALSVVRLVQDSRDEVRLDNYESLTTPEQARQAISLYALEHAPTDLSAEHLRAAVAIARAAVRPNLFYNQLITEERRAQARGEVETVVIPVPRGTAIVRAGDVVTDRQAEMIRQVSDLGGQAAAWESRLSIAALCAMAFMTLYGFGVGYVRRFSTSVRDIESMAFLVLIVLASCRALATLSAPMAQLFGYSAQASSFWYLIPFAGGAMLVRILVGAESALLFVLPTSVLCGMMLDNELLFVLYFMIVGVAGVAGMESTGERLGVLKAGLQTGLVGAVAALLLDLGAAQLGPTSGAANADGMHVLWDVGLAVLGGVFSSFMVLALVPIFEMLGYLTDYKLLELANLNHPLIRQLMLRAPGSYHHSIIVSTLSEAAAQAIGGNALLARVCCYFHDVGKAIKPQYFIENQRNAPNRHNRLEPRVSARIIINHVLDGAAIARQYKLPQPIVEGVYMHHGTGLIQYFYAKALERAAPGEVIDEAEFRYPGPRPNSREHGIIMLADKVEAACRTIKDPTPEKLREMIQKLVNSTIEDGQFEDCPLTLKELYTIIDTFTHTLVGIYHQRIEYPGVKRPPLSVPQSQRGAVITLEVPGPFPRKDTEPDSPDEELEEEASDAVSKG